MAFLDEKELRASACRRRLAAWNPDGQTTLMDALACLDLIDREYRKPTLPFEIARHLNLSHLGVLGYLCLSCDNLGEIFTRSSRFYHLIWKGLRLELLVEDDELTVRWHAAGEIPEELSNAIQILCAIGMAGNIRLCRLLVGEEFIPRRVVLPSPEPSDCNRWESYLECPVEFKHRTASWTIAISSMQLPIRRDSDLLRNSVERQIEMQLAHVARNDDFLQAVQQINRRSLQEGIPTIEYVSAAMSISRATLYRRIATRGSSFRQLLDDIRFSLAQVYLGEANLTLSDIAALLGFSEQSAFTRSFRRRAGMSPRRFRNNRNSG